MIRLDNHLGKITVSNSYFSNLVGYVAKETFGVVGLADSTPIEGIRAMISKKAIPDRGVKVRVVDNKLVVDLHIIVNYGLNISAIVKSIANKVAYTLESVSGLSVAKVNVYVADMYVE